MKSLGTRYEDAVAWLGAALPILLIVPMVCSVGAMVGMEEARALESDRPLDGALLCGELWLVFAIAVAAASTLNGGPGLMSRTLPLSGAATLDYLQRGVVRVRWAAAGLIASFFLGLVANAAHGTVAQALGYPLAALVAARLACRIAVDLAWLATLAAGGRADLALAVGGVGGAVATALLAARFSESVGCYVPLHWPANAVVALVRGELAPAAGWLALSAVAALGLRRLLVHELGEPFRAAAAPGTEGGAGAPAARARRVEPDRAPRAAPPLPAFLWLASRTAGMSGDRLLPRVLCATALWTATLPLLSVVHRLGGVPLHALARSLAPGLPAWLFAGVVFSMIFALAPVTPFEMPCSYPRSQRWARVFPSWIMLPVRPWRTAAGRVLVAALAGFTALAVLGAVYAAVTLAAFGAIPPWVAPGVVGGCALVLCALAAGAVNSVVMQACDSWMRSLHPLVRIGAAVAFLGVATGMVVLSLYGRAIGCAVLAASGAAIVMLVLRQLWRLDRGDGTDIIELPQPSARGQTR